MVNTFLTAFLVTLVVYLRQGAAGLRTPSEADWPENIDLFLGWSGPPVAQKNVDDQAPRSDDTARDRDNGELKYFLRSVGAPRALGPPRMDCSQHRCGTCQHRRHQRHTPSFRLKGHGHRD